MARHCPDSLGSVRGHAQSAAKKGGLDSAVHWSTWEGGPQSIDVPQEKPRLNILAGLMLCNATYIYVFTYVYIYICIHHTYQISYSCYNTYTYDIFIQFHICVYIYIYICISNKLYKDQRCLPPKLPKAPCWDQLAARHPRYRLNRIATQSNVSCQGYVWVGRGGASQVSIGGIY